MTNGNTKSRCWIVGNGVSLKETPLDLLIGEDTFGLNRIRLAYDKTEWRPTYYIKAEFLDGDPLWAVIPNLENPDTHCFLNAGRAVDCEGVIRPRFPINATYMRMSCKHQATNAFSEGRPTEWHLPDICVFGGVTNIALQIIAMMGRYEEVYLIGMDLDWKHYNRDLEPDPNHFDPAYGEWDMHPLSQKDETQLIFYEIAKKVYAERGIKIFNATIGGKLELFERVDMRDVLCH